MKQVIQVAAGLIQKDGKYLITQRKPGGHLGLFWEFPGGKKEQNETLEDCLKRELGEELEIDSEVGCLLMKTEHEYSDRVVQLYFYECQMAEGEPQKKDCHDFKWVLPQEMNEKNFPPADALLIQRLQKMRREA